MWNDVAAVAWKVIALNGTSSHLELFSLQCATCRRRLRVQDLRAVGQILPCPKCGSLVQVTPPVGWQPPEFDLPETKVTGGISAAGEQLASDSERVIVSPPSPWADSPSEQDLARESADVGPPSPRRRGRAWTFAALAALLSTALGYALWHTPPADHLAAKVEGVSAPAAAGEIDHRAAAAPDPPHGDLAASPREPAFEFAPPVDATENQPHPEPADSTDDRAPVATAPVQTPPAEPAAAPADALLPDEATTAAPTDEAPLDAPSDPAPQLEFLRREPLPTVDAQAQMSQPIAGLVVRDRPLCEFALLMSRLGGCPMALDTDSLRTTGVSVDVLVQIETGATTIGAALDLALNPLALTAVVELDHVRIVAARGAPPADAPQTIELAAEWAGHAAQLAEVIERVVAPRTWRSAGGTGAIEVEGGSLRVEQWPAVQRQIAALLADMQAAQQAAVDRPKERRDEPPNWPAAEAWLAAPVSANFRPAAALSRVLGRLAEQAHVRVALDQVSLARAGVAEGELVELSVHEESLEDALEAVLGPLGSTYRATDERTLEIVGWQSAAEWAAPVVFPLTDGADPDARREQARRILATWSSELANAWPACDQKLLGVELITGGQRSFIVLRAPLPAVLRLARIVGAASEFVPMDTVTPNSPSIPAAEAVEP